jgi:Rps23 Pro-64 3,4-dihydroxylase Tpa1-like proline 4-hydroxylase
MDIKMKKKIISKSFYNLNSYALKNKLKYQNLKPYPHLVIKNFFNINFLNEVLNEFPNLPKIKSSTNYNNQNEIKFANNNKKSFKKNTRLFFKFLNSNEFLNFIKKLSSIDEKLLPDSYLSGGGLHEIKKGGVLKVHTDFNKHPFKNLDRRINVLIYLNKNWKKKYGGDLELWNKNMKKCVVKVPPIFNTMVVFSTNDFTNHGHPNPLKCPESMSRKSIATYYFSRGRPSHEITKTAIKNTTKFKNRKGKLNDVSVKSEYIKNLLRNLTIYQYIKNFEKKYLRTGKSKRKRKN